MTGWDNHDNCKANRQYLLTLQVSRYCLFALQSSVDSCKIATHVCSWRIHWSAIWMKGSFRVHSPRLIELNRIYHYRYTKLKGKTKRQYPLTLQVSRYCLLALQSSAANSVSTLTFSRDATVPLLALHWILKYFNIRFEVDIYISETSNRPHVLSDIVRRLLLSCSFLWNNC